MLFGRLTSGPLTVDCGVKWRNLSTSGPGINTNYLMDISPEWTNKGGPSFVDALNVRCWAFPSLGHHQWVAIVKRHNMVFSSSTRTYLMNISSGPKMAAPIPSCRHFI